MNMPMGLEYWTCDEVAECMSYEKYLPDSYTGSLYGKLWGFLSEAKNPTPVGGDGSNGTVEYPDARLGLENDDKCAHWWDRLTQEEQQAIAKAYEEL